MPAFAYLSRFREGQWRSFRRFLLEERRDASARFDVINAERIRIGEINIIYAKTPNGENGEVTESRVGMSIEPADSSLAKLVGAYVSLGGNPFDISMFLTPNSDLSDETKGRVFTQPGGGILHGQNIKYAYDQSVNDGDTNLKKYKTSRSGGRKNTAKQHEIATIMGHGRAWVSKEIRWKRTRLEELIIKLCDLREQLDEEVEQMIWATRGDMQADQSYDEVRFNDSLTAGNIAYFFDSTFRVPSKTDVGRVEYNNEADVGEAGSVNLPVLSGFDGLISDDDDEDNTAF